ncbi:MAG TPA: hypothetical protein PJ991_11510 [Kiritimatiellia bacterium]|nr:hypothetical protein [Kiritimatiellia bacterium]
MKSKSFKLLIAALTFMGVHAFATPPNTPTLDALVIEYDDVDLRSSFTGALGDPGNLAPWGADNMLTNLYVTWDSQYLYVAAQGYVEVGGNANKIGILIDVDPENGTGATTTTNWTGTGIGYIDFNDIAWTVFDESEFGADYMIASEGFFNNVLRIEYDGVAIDTNSILPVFDSGNGSAPAGTPVDVVSAIRKDPMNYLINGIEARIPWSELYNSARFGVIEPGEVVPRGAKLRLFANLHVNQAGFTFSSPIVIPPQGVNASYDNGFIISDTYVEVVIDAANDGFPDVLSGDVNPPYLKFVTGVQGMRQVFAWFNEALDPTTAEDVANWTVGTFIPESVDLVQSDAVLISLTNDLPANGNFVRVEASGVEDLSGNSKTTFRFFDPASSGLGTSVTVRFLLNKNSGMGNSAANPRVTTNLFINGSSAPLEFGYPPAKIAPLIMLNSTQYYRDVTFPPGTPQLLFYKYSGVLDGGALATGTNNYEAVRLDNYANAARQLLLPTNGLSSLVVTDWLGAAAAPYRDPGTNSGYNALYTDIRRGDAGVRQRTVIKFQLDLNNRDLTGVTRVMVMGTDPLRGFNMDNSNFSDFPGPLVQWSEAGIELFDDGTNGDLVAGDGIFSRDWAWTPTGSDATMVPGFPNSLVGGDGGTSPYFGFGWVDGRSYRSFKYKFFLYRGLSQQNFEYPFSDVEYYIPASTTNIVLAPVVWGNDAIPLPPPTNSPTMVEVVFSNNQTIAIFENTDLQHGLFISSNLEGGFQDYGLRAVTTATLNVWRSVVPNATPFENYAAFAGPAKPAYGSWFAPNPAPETGGIVRVWYRQHGRDLAGRRDVGITGTITTPQWSDAIPMTFYGDGTWFYDLNITNMAPVLTQVKPRSLSGQYEGGPDLYIYRGEGRATWSPNTPQKADVLEITYNANGGPLAASTNVNAWVGFDDQWFEASNRKMTNAIGETNIWEIAFPVPTNYTLSVNFVFNDGGNWDSEGNPGNGGRVYRAFLDPTPFP